MGRRTVQWLSTLSMNPYLVGFWQGRIYKGASKHLCVPGLNCYSCPGAIGACPLGALQVVIASSRYTISYYVIGTLLVFGTLGGRWICGWLCPFGLVQEILHKIPSPKIIIPQWMRYIKYLLLLVFVLLLPALWVNTLGMGDPTFCKYICPAGTLESGIPLLLTNPPLREAAGNLFLLKLVLLIVTILLSIIIFRPFCRVACPLGAIYGLFNPISIYRYQVDPDRCISCGKCADQCKMGSAMYQQANSPECIRCGQCSFNCPTDAISLRFEMQTKTAVPKKL